MRRSVLIYGVAVFGALLASGAGGAAAQCVTAGDACDDGLYCTTGDVCDAALACSGAARGCGDSNPCTTDTCNEGTNSCDHADRPAGGTCDDGLYCTVSDTCDGSGTCVAGPARSCDDGEACTTDSCSESGNACLNTPMPGWCRIRGSCVMEGAVDPDGDSLCEQCVPSVSANQYSNALDGTPCGAASCVEGVFTAADLCNAIGTCVLGRSTPCSSEACATTTTCAACIVDADCADAEHCAGTECVTSFAVGMGCDRLGQCAAGECVDGVCCNGPCAGSCESCDAVDRAGICTPHPADTDPEDECLAASCDGVGACLPPTDGAAGDASAEAGPAPRTGGLSVHGSGCIACSVGPGRAAGDLAGLFFSLAFVLGLGLRRRR